MWVSTEPTYELKVPVESIVVHRFQVIQVRVHPEQSLVDRIHCQTSGIEDLAQFEIKAVAAVHVGSLYAGVVARTRIAQVRKEEVPSPTQTLTCCIMHDQACWNATEKHPVVKNVHKWESARVGVSRWGMAGTNEWLSAWASDRPTNGVMGRCGRDPHSKTNALSFFAWHCARSTLQAKSFVPFVWLFPPKKKHISFVCPSVSFFITFLVFFFKRVCSFPI